MIKSLFGALTLLVVSLLLFCSNAFSQDVDNVLRKDGSISNAEKKNGNYLTDFLNDPNPLVRLEAANMLGVEHLIEALKDESLLVRYYASRRLLFSAYRFTQQYAPQIKNALFEAMNKDKPIVALLIADGYPDTAILTRLYKDKEDKFREEAFQKLLGYSTEQEQLKLITDSIYDGSSKIRLLSVLLLRDLKVHNADAQRLYDKVKEEDTLIKRFLGYLECLKSKETIMDASVALSDSDPKLSEIFVFYLLKTYSEGRDEFLLPLIHEGIKSTNVKVRLTVSGMCLTYGKYMDESREIFTQSLEEFIKIKEEELAFSAIIALEELPEEAIPDIAELTRIFNDKRHLVRWGLIQTLREMVYYKRSVSYKQKEIESFLSDKDPTVKIILDKGYRSHNSLISNDDNLL